MAMPITEPWTVEQLDRLPDDGNRYELLDGELFVTPAPSDVHDWILYWLHTLLDPFVRANGLGWIQHRGVIRQPGTHLEPDLIVRPHAPLGKWEDAPRPLLVVEVLSASTRIRDLGKKRDFYVSTGIPEYWIVDRRDEVIIQVRGEQAERVSTLLSWSPPGASATLDVDAGALFAEIRQRTV